MLPNSWALILKRKRDLTRPAPPLDLRGGELSGLEHYMGRPSLQLRPKSLLLQHPVLTDVSNQSDVSVRNLQTGPKCNRTLPVSDS